LEIGEKETVWLKMAQNNIKAESNKCAIYHALKLQELWKKEIDEAIKVVKRRVPDSKCKSYK
jgi:hypothetical protein